MQNIMEIERKGLRDIKSFTVNKAETIEKKASAIDLEKGFDHMNEEYVVRVFFKKDTQYSATDAIRDYIHQIAELKY